MLEKYILDHIKIISETKIFELPKNVTGTLTLYPDKIDLWVNEHPFYNGVHELIKFFTEKSEMFDIEAYSEDGTKMRLEKCVKYKWGEKMWGIAAKNQKPPTITGIGIQSLNVKWYYDNSH